MLLLCAFLVLMIGGCGSGGSEPTAQTNTEGTTSNNAISEGSNPSSTSSNPTARLTPIQGSGVSGEATFKDVSVGVAGVDNDVSEGVEVDLDIQGLPAQPTNDLLEAHIHQGGTCSDARAGEEVPVEYTLSSVDVFSNGTGASTTTVAGVSTGELLSGPPKYIDVHAEQTENEAPPPISCANLS
jgi:hypothetical protein